ncbi:MAG: alpha/beta fold hydrolase [Bacteroidota bacterium]
MLHDDYRPPFLLRNRHLNTVFAPLFRRQKRPPFVRQRLTTKDGDFLDIDLLIADDTSPNQRLVVLCHGLEGSSESQYVLALAKLFHADNWDVVALNYRGCSGEMNRLPQMYHSGMTSDLDMVIQHLEAPYQSIGIVGISMGGNLSLVYVGEQSADISPKIKGLVAISVPTDLVAGVRQIMRPINYVYEQRFLRSLLAKMRLKSKQYPAIFTTKKIKRVRTLYEFDDTFTAPLHGFKDALDYYTQCSSGRFIDQIRVPTLIINALDDPFLPSACYPQDAVQNNSYVDLLTPKYGGHVGFVEFGQSYYWEERRSLQFLNQLC